MLKKELIKLKYKISVNGYESGVTFSMELTEDEFDLIERVVNLCNENDNEYAPYMNIEEKRKPSLWNNGDHVDFMHMPKSEFLKLRGNRYSRDNYDEIAREAAKLWEI